MPPNFAPRKLLVAAVGVATLNYLAGVACTPTPTTGNLPAPTAEPDAGTLPPPTALPPTSGNLPAPQPVETAAPAASSSADASTTTTAPSASAAPPGSNRNVKPQFKPPRPPTAGNLMMPSGNQTK